MIAADRFDEIVSRCLTPALQQHGLRRVATDPYQARFEGPGLVVVIGLDIYRTSELHAWVGQPEDDAGLMSVDTLEPPFATGMATDEHELADALDRLTAFLMTNHQGLLSGDPLAFVDAVDHLRESAHEYTQRVMNAPILERAEIAWRRRDFTEVVELLAPIRGSLDQPQLRRLEYALSQEGQAQ